jgi:hypothetical protein
MTPTLLIRLMMQNTTISADPDDRVRAFRRQLDAWVQAERPGLPVFALPGVLPAHRRRCLSCGARIKRGRLRCEECIVAIATVLMPVEDLVTRIAIPPPPWWKR